MRMQRRKFADLRFLYDNRISGLAEYNVSVDCLSACRVLLYDDFQEAPHG